MCHSTLVTAKNKYFYFYYKVAWKNIGGEFEYLFLVESIYTIQTIISLFLNFLTCAI